MGTAQSRYQIPSPQIQFRVLVVGRANAGKTSILQRVCETTNSLTIYRGEEEVTLNPSMDRGEHCIDDELVFSNHTGYVFHDSQGIEAGDEEKLEILKGFILRKCGERRLQDRLHAIWYCIPMDNHRPGLDLRLYEDICPDQNVPVIAVFTKYDQFRRNVLMDVLDDPDRYPDSDVSQVAEKLFQEHYLCPLGDDVRYVRLEKMHMNESRCDSLIETTAAVLNEDTVALMLSEMQRGNLESSANTALSRSIFATSTESFETVVNDSDFLPTQVAAVSERPQSVDTSPLALLPNLLPELRFLNPSCSLTFIPNGSLETFDNVSEVSLPTRMAASELTQSVQVDSEINLQAGLSAADGLPIPPPSTPLADLPPELRYSNPNFSTPSFSGSSFMFIPTGSLETLANVSDTLSSAPHANRMIPSHLHGQDQEPAR